jgi:hypothetical protein
MAAAHALVARGGAWYARLEITNPGASLSHWQARYWRSRTRITWDLTRPLRGPTLPLNRRSASDVQDNEGTAEASKKGKEGGEEGEEGRQKGRYVECSTKVSLRHVDILTADAAPEFWTLLIASLTAVAGWIAMQASARIERERHARRTRQGLQN